MFSCNNFLSKSDGSCQKLKFLVPGMLEVKATFPVLWMLSVANKEIAIIIEHCIIF